MTTAGIKVSQLDVLTQLDDNDIFLVTDTSGSVSSQVTYATLKSGLDLTVVDGDGNITVDLTPINDLITTLQGRLDSVGTAIGVGHMETHMGDLPGNLFPSDSTIKEILEVIEDEISGNDHDISVLQTQQQSVVTDYNQLNLSLNTLTNLVNNEDIALKGRLDALEGAGFLTEIPATYVTETELQTELDNLTLAGIAGLTGTPGEGQVLKYISGGWVFAPDVDTDTTVDLTGYATEAWVQSQGYSTGGGGGGIQLNDLSVITNQVSGGSGGLSYNNITGEFTFTQASPRITLTDVANDGFIKLADVDLSGYATEAWVQSQGYSTGGGGGSATVDAQNFTWNDHIIPDTNATYDLGNAEYKVRHLFLSDNSIKFESGDLGVDSGKVTFQGEPIASEAWVGTRGYLTTIPAQYLTNTDIAAGYVSKTDTEFNLVDGQNAAFDFKEGSNVYLRFNTFNSGEKVQILKDLWVSEGIHCADYIMLDGNNKELKFANSGGTYVGLKAPLGLASDIVFTLPGTDGTNGQVLTTDGAGNFGWSTPAAGGGGATTLDGLSDVSTSGALNGQVLKYNGSSWAPQLDIQYDDTAIQALVSQLEATLTKLVPPAPTTIDGLGVTLTGTSGTYRFCANHTPVDNGTGNLPVAGDSVLTGRNRSVGTSTIGDVGPGDSGTVTLRLNGNPDSQHTMTSGDDNGTYGNLVISDNKDASQSTRDSGIVADFYQVYDLKADTVTVSEGMNGIYFEHGTEQTDSVFWYEDATQDMTPAITFGAPTAVGGYSTNYSSSVPHYANGTEFVYTTNLSNITSDFYNNNNNVLTTSGNTTGFNNSGNYQYDDITGGSLPPPRNFGQNQAEQVINGVKVTVRDTHATIDLNATNNQGVPTAFRPHTLITPFGNVTERPTKNVIINIMGDTARTNVVDEDNILVDMGTGTGNAIRMSQANGDTPAAAAGVWDPTAALQVWDAAVVGGVLSCNQTNYQSYEPAGPDLSARDTDQYITFKITRSQVSQFTINYTGSCDGCWVKMENNATWTGSLNGYNGWGDMFKAYKGSGVPDDNANGVASGGVMDTDGGSFTCVFGTESSSNDTNNEILVRFKLTTGQSITALSFTS